MLAESALVGSLTAAPGFLGYRTWLPDVVIPRRRDVPDRTSVLVGVGSSVRPADPNRQADVAPFSERSPTRSRLRCSASARTAPTPCSC